MKNKNSSKITSRIPNLICPGAQKAGTTTLFLILRQHPDIGEADYKEIQFFDKYYRKGIDWYIKMCKKSSGHKYIMDFTPGYMTEKIYLERMKKVLEEDVKIIVILRNPIDRMYSTYLMNLRIGLEVETNSMKAFNRDYNGYLKGDKTTNYFEHSLYSKQVSQLKELFSAKNLKIILFEDMISNTEKVATEIFEFLELDLPANMDFNVWANNSHSKKDHWIIRFTRRIFKHNTNILRRLIPYKLSKYIKKTLHIKGQKPGIVSAVKKDPKVCSILRDRCLDDIKKLEVILGIKLDIWLDKYSKKEFDNS